MEDLGKMTNEELCRIKEGREKALSANVTAYRDNHCDTDYGAYLRDEYNGDADDYGRWSDDLREIDAEIKRREALEGKSICESHENSTEVKKRRRKMGDFDELSDEDLSDRARDIIEELNIFNFRDCCGCLVSGRVLSIEKILKQLKLGIELAEISLELRGRGCAIEMDQLRLTEKKEMCHEKLE